MVLIAVNGFPFSNSLQTPLRAAFCGLCGGFPPHEKASNKINRKTRLPHCTSGVSQPIPWHAGIPKPSPRIPPPPPRRGLGWDQEFLEQSASLQGTACSGKSTPHLNPSCGFVPAAAFCLDTPVWGATGSGEEYFWVFSLSFKLVFGYPSPSAWCKGLLEKRCYYKGF